MKNLLAILSLCLFSLAAFAEPTPDECQNFIWDAVTTDTLGNAITVDGYRINYGSTPGTYTGHSDVGDVLTADIVSVLPAADGMYYAALTALKTTGADTLESAYSNEVQIQILGGVARHGGVPASPGLFRLQCTFTFATP